MYSKHLKVPGHVRRKCMAFTLVEVLVATIILAVAGLAILNSMVTLRASNGYLTNQGVALRKLNDTASFLAVGNTGYAQYDDTTNNLANPYFTYTMSLTTGSMPYMQRSTLYQTYEWAGQTMTNSVVLVRPIDAP